MGNILIDNDSLLSTVDYSKIINGSREAIKNIKVGVKDNKIVFGNISKAVDDIAKSFKGKDSLFIEREKKPKIISSNINDYEEFSKEITKLKSELREKVKDEVKNLRLDNIEVIKGNRIDTSKNFGFNYEFNSKSFDKQKVGFDKNIAFKNGMARVDEVNINIETKNIEKSLKDNLINILRDNIDDEDDFEDREEDVLNKKQDIKKLEELLSEEILGRINRTIAYLYLEVLLKESNNNDKAYTYLIDYVRRFKLLDKYLTELSFKANNEAIVTFNRELNISSILSNSNAFDCLPVVGIVEGVIFEGKNDNYKNFKFGLKVKNNGFVNRDDLVKTSSYQYWTKLMSGQIKEEKENDNKKLKALLLYNFMLRNLGDLNFDPVENWKDIKREIDDCKGSTKLIELKIRDYVKFLNSENTEDKVNNICKLLENTLRHTSSRENSYNFHKIVVLYKQILDDNLEDGTFFKKPDYYVENLKYVSIVEEIKEVSNIFMSFNININFKSSILYENGSKEHTELDYDLEKLKILPVLFYPNTALENNITTNKEQDNKFIKDTFKCVNSQSLIAFSYIKDNYFKDKAYSSIYNIIYSLLVTISVKVILEELNIEDKKELFIPIVRAHLEEKDGAFIRGYSKTLEHILSQDYLSSSQGFDIKGSRYKYNNAICSLYGKLPKKFVEKNHVFSIKNMAIMIVTSITADASRNNRKKNITTILGEVILYEVNEENVVRCRSYKTFTDNISSEDLFRSSRVLIDTVNEIYNLGYKDILYIAKAPYSSTLNITEEKENLYFMNEIALEKMMEQKSNLMIYPTYFSYYNAFSLKNHSNALYINDNREIDKMLSNQDSSIAGIFNLYSGRVVGNLNRNYRKVIIYSTLCNKYENKQFNSKIYRNLVESGSCKIDITKFITMYHYSRYEKAEKDITIKINPYEHLIGDDSVAKLSIFNLDEKGYLKFNNLSFLTEIYKVINKED